MHVCVCVFMWAPDGYPDGTHIKIAPAVRAYTYHPRTFKQKTHFFYIKIHLLGALVLGWYAFSI